jgi:O-acetyl-ADP-ribose deacetylase (regulator of RNase III)
MINYVVGDLLGAPQKVIIHGCNAQGVMGSGVAVQIRNKWPNVYKLYELEHKTFGLKLGTIIPVETPDGKIIVNCITQDNFGRSGERFVDYDAIKNCFDQLNDKVDAWEVTEIAMPRIGAGLGGGDWPTIEDIIVKSAKNFIQVVYDIQ